MAIKAKKFGTFAGVFTPSLLTILGVIMYMRLGWVVGNAGLIYALVVILLAHVISLSTGLSVSSIATDKRIKAGGIYYVLSRSLGLPMGGAIGITLFVGTALSISLYLVGFAESVLSVDPIREFLGLQQDINGFRIIGTGAIVVLVIIAFISTSLAIKTQFYILGAIALSLVSIGVGFFVNSGYHPEGAILAHVSNEWDPVLIFAVFFPAVTGFTAGIAMSGDLKDPKKAIPQGTMGAIAVGFIVYVGLAIGFGFFVNRELLLSDTNFLLKVAWFAPLVIAGIWGATLSSALGGILGGPRILQAIASDRIGPKLFAKGYGINNEPRNALIFIFLIAEAGILIGELNVIAEVVSMFYLASYGFINLAFYLESWASTDFRPSFRVNKYIGLIGFLAAFGVMFRLNFPAMIAALVIVGGIYFYLKRRQLKLEYGDVWQSVWSTFMRTALQKMDNTETHERNWQPNIILFSGGTKKRPHLLELGRSFVGTHGVLSNFDLIEQKDAKILFPKNKQSTPGQQSEKGVFTRQQTVQDVYAGIDMIARTYGFSGVEPNTVMLGWARQTQNPERFAGLLNTFYDLDLNVILLGYDKRFGYGQYKTIDIWFKDQSNNGNLALTLTKLLLLSEKWQNARARLLIVNYKNEKSEIVARKAEAILDQMRVNAKVKVINNQVDQKPFYDIVHEESDTTDLVFFEIPDFTEGSASEFIEHTNDLLEKIGTVVMISGSSAFKKLKIGLETDDVKYPEQAISVKSEVSISTQIELPADPMLAETIQKSWDEVQAAVNRQVDTMFSPLLQYRANKIKATRQIVLKSIQTVEERFSGIKKDQQKQFLNRIKTSLIARLDMIIDEQTKLIEKEKTDYLEPGFEDALAGMIKLMDKAPEKVKILLYGKDLSKEHHDRLSSKYFKWRKRFGNSKKALEKGIEYTILYKKALRSKTLSSFASAQIKAFDQFHQFHDRFISEYRKLFYAITDAFSYLESNGIKAAENESHINSIKQSISDHLNQLDEMVSHQQKSLSATITEDLKDHFTALSYKLKRVPANHFIETPHLRLEKEKELQLIESPALWLENQQVQLNTLLLELRIMQVDFRLSALVRESLAEVKKEINEGILKHIKDLGTALDSLSGNGEPKLKGHPAQTLKDFSYNDQQLRQKINKLIEKIFRNTRTIQRIIPETVTLYNSQETASGKETIQIPVSRILDYHIQNLLMEPLHTNTFNLVQSIHEAATRVEDSVRLISLSSRKEQSDFALEDIEFVADMGGFIKEQQAKIREQQKSIINLLETYERNIQNYSKEAADEFAVYRLIKSAESITQFSPQKTAALRLEKLKTSWKKLGNYLQEQRANLWHTQSEARLMAQRFNEQLDASANAITQAITLTEKVSPSNLIRKKIPFYYQQLFSGKFNFQPELWIGRADAINLAKHGLQRFKSGQQGIFIITGRRRSGKSFFSSYLAGNVFLNRKVFHIRPNAGGSSNPEQILSMIREATGYTGTIDEIMHALPENSVLIFDDIQLLWEKSQGGTKGLQFLADTMKAYCQRLLFVINCETNAWGIISKQVPLGDLAIQHIELKPFNSKDLQQIIMLRHRTSGFGLQVDSAVQNAISLTRQARLFSRIFSQSDGNVGSALLLWISSINDFKDNIIHIHTPVGIDSHILDALDASHRLVLLQFVLHKRMDIDKLQRVMLEERIKVINYLQVMLRAGLLIEQAGPVFEINPYVYDQVLKSLSEDYL
ncbi:MAG TPA: hypothetical protein PK904_14085 [Bacteroidales bacterium]|nr:hypothetical protein [Bacteroidales bacterium]